jgi:hypothetical protein
MAVGGQRHVPAALFPVKWRVAHFTGDSLDHRVSMGIYGKSHRPLRLDPRTFHPVASRYTNWDISLHYFREELQE